MDNREVRRKIAEDTLEIVKTGYYQTSTGKTIEIGDIQRKAEENTRLYSPAQTDELIQTDFKEQSAPTQFSVTGQTTLDAVKELFKAGHVDVACLNFASAKNPGGGFLGGSQAQEESLARASGLYPCLLKASAYYETNRNTRSCFYTDYMIYSPSVPIFKGETGNHLEELVYCGVITAPAVNTGVVREQEPKRLSEVEVVMKRRIRKVLAIALTHGHHTIVLGAWGCGVFQNDPRQIAQYFREVLTTDFKNKFKKVVFAVYATNEKFIKPFQEAFKEK
jgi:uncharacterized protein (TIGR02452 family)